MECSTAAPTSWMRVVVWWLKSLPKGRGNVRTEFINRRVVTISSTYLFRKSTLEEIGGFDENMTSHIDYDIWMKMAKADVHSD